MFQQQRLKIAESSYAYLAIDKILVIKKKQTIGDKMIMFKERREKEVECSVQWDVQQGIKMLAKQNRILQSIIIRQFLNLNEEQLDFKFDKVVEGIAKAYSIGDELYKTDE